MTENSSRAEFDSGVLVSNSPSTASRRSPSPCTGEAFTCNFLHIYHQVSFTRIHFLSHQTKHPAIYTGIGASVYLRGVLIFDVLTARSIYTLSIYLSGFLDSYRRASQFRLLTASAICRMSTFFHAPVLPSHFAEHRRVIRTQRAGHRKLRIWRLTIGSSSETTVLSSVIDTR